MTKPLRKSTARTETRPSAQLQDTLLVVDNPAEWPLNVPHVEVLAAEDYLTLPLYRELPRAKVFNLCRSYKYQTAGYYVSLLAEARGHKPIPSVSTIQDMKSPGLVRLASEDLEELIQAELATVKSDTFVLSIYFGKNLAKRLDRLAGHLFRWFHAPFIRAHFSRTGTTWQLTSIGPISANAIPAAHQPFVVRATYDFLGQRPPRAQAPRVKPRFDLAILAGTDQTPPSNRKALDRFARAAETLGINAELVTRDDYQRIAEFDALFIRETTAVNHHTYRFARRAEAEGLVVIDDPLSIVKCTNKVYLTELMNTHKVRIPKTIIVHRDNLDEVGSRIGFPCVLKQPDSAFSRGVIKVSTPAMLTMTGDSMLETSELFLAQEFIPTEFDWRIGVIGGQLLYACRYWMAKSHWQITRRTTMGRTVDGRVECVDLDQVPSEVIDAALQSAALIGDGLYGVDIKVHEGVPHVIEVNDNPNIDAGFEDKILQGELYNRLAREFLARIEQRKQGRRAG